VCIFISTLAYLHINTLSAQELTLLFAGDAMQHQSQITNAYRNGTYDYSSYFKHIKKDVSKADIAVVNLEVTLGGKPYTGYPTFSAPDEYAVALKDAGFDVFLTSNNHSLDKGKKGLERTIDMLDSLNVRHLGTYKNSDEKLRSHPMVLTKNGIRLAFLNYTYGTNGINVTPPNIVNYIDTIQMKKDIKDAKGFLNADLVIACVHWGDEYELIQNKEQERLSKLMLREGVDMLIGSHPHVVQPTNVLKNNAGEISLGISQLKNDENQISKVVVYSLGNFISGMSKDNTDGGQMIKVVVSKKDFKTKIKSCSYQLVYVDKQKKGNKIDFSLLPVRQFENMKDSISSNSYNKMMTFAKNARGLFHKYNINCLEDTDIEETDTKEEIKIKENQKYFRFFNF